MNILLVLPIITPFIAAILNILAWRRVPLQRLITLSGTFLHFMFALLLFAIVYQEGIQVEQIGGWSAPFGITVVADMLTAIMLLITGFMGFMVAIYSLGNIDAEREAYGYYPLFCILLMGVSGAFTTGDLFNMYVWFEVLLISSFVLMVLGGEPRQLAGGIQYMTLNLVSSTILLSAIGMVYATTGTLNMADIAGQIGEVQQAGIVRAMSLMFLIAFGIKAALFPLFFWLPISYHTPPAPVTAIFAALLTKVGVYAILRVYTLIFVDDLELLKTILLVVGGATMVGGVFGAVVQYNFRRLLSFHIISQIGYMIMGIAIYTPLGIAGAIYFMIHNIIAKSNLFLISGIVYKLRGTYDLHELGALYRKYPILGVLFLIPALSLAGIPPLSGFWGKFILVKGALDTENYVITFVALFVSVWTLYSMIKIWMEAFLKDTPQPVEDNQNIWDRSFLAMMLPVVILALVTILLGVALQPVYDVMIHSAEQLLNRQEYITAVLGEKAP